VADDGQPLVGLRSTATEAGVRLAFSDPPRRNARRSLYFVRPRLVSPILTAASDFASSGQTLVIEDAFRTAGMQRQLTASDKVLAQFAETVRQGDPATSPDRIVDRLSVFAATCPKTAGHMAGAAIDVFVLDSGGRILDCGRPPLRAAKAIPLVPPKASREAARNRRYVSEILRGHGFTAHPFDVGHFSLDDAFQRIIEHDQRPAFYGPLELRPGGVVTPALNQLAPFDNRDELVLRVTRLLRSHPRRAHRTKKTRHDADWRLRPHGRH